MMMRTRRRMLSFSEAQAGQIIITAADSTNYVTVGGTTYTSAITLPVEEETKVIMYVGYEEKLGGFYKSGNEYIWTVDGVSETLKAKEGLNWRAFFGAHMGNVYTIDAVNHTINVDTSNIDLSELCIYSSSSIGLEHGSYLSSSGCGFDVYNGVYLSLSSNNGANDAGDSPYAIIGPIDFTGYSKLHITASLNTTGEADADYYFVGYGTGSSSVFSGAEATQGVQEHTSTLSFDISSINAERNIYLCSWSSGGAEVQVYRIWLER